MRVVVDIDPDVTDRTDVLTKLQSWARLAGTFPTVHYNTQREEYTVHIMARAPRPVETVHGERIYVDDMAEQVGLSVEETARLLRAMADNARARAQR